MNPNTIFWDKREIKSLVFEYDNMTIYSENSFNNSPITKIEPYKESGEMSPVIWFKIWHGDFLAERINGKFVLSVVYKKEN